MVCLHGFTDTWRTWELVLPALERRHDVLAPTLPGHAGGPPLPAVLTIDAILDGLESILDEAAFATAHIVGNSLGGYLALRLAARGRARSVVALAPAGGWAPGDRSFEPTLEHFEVMRRQLEAAAPHAEAILSTDGGRRQATRYVSVRYRHIPAELLAHQMRGVVACTGMEELLELARRCGWPLRPERIECPIRIVWGDSDQLLPWPRSAAGYRTMLPHADWVELPGVGHAPQLDVPLQAAELILGHTAR
jgi:pimeloyl-ACP methyl ester carboxylesterase